MKILLLIIANAVLSAATLALFAVCAVLGMAYRAAYWLSRFVGEQSIELIDFTLDAMGVKEEVKKWQAARNSA